MDNADRYDTLYVSGAAAGAVAERFGTFANWGDWLLAHPRGFDARLVTFDLAGDRALLGLDDAQALLERSLRPSRVVTRDRQATQAWAAAIYDEQRWAGISWWSYYNPDWTSAALWCAPGEGAVAGLGVVAIDVLGGDHPAVIEAGRSLLRPWSPNHP